MKVHLDRLKVVLKKRSIGGWVLWVLAASWKRLGDWQNVVWLQQHFLPKAWSKTTLHPDYVTIALVVGGFVWFTVILLWPRRDSKKPERIDDQSGPDLSLEWMETKEWPHWDRLRIRNIGNASAFNIGLRFSWEELSFSPPFDKNVLHANEEITQEAHFSERTGPRSSNIGRMDEILTIAFLGDRTPSLQVIATFSDGRKKFEKSFTFELGPGGQNAERIRITPGPRKRI